MQKIISLDLETTGLNIATDRIVEIACVSFDGSVTDDKHTLVNPLIKIPKEASDIHGITDEMVREKPTFKQLSKSILSLIDGAVILTYNGNSYDIPLLYAEFTRAGIDWDYSKCVLIDACSIFKRKEPRDLTAAMKFYCGSEIEGAHSALADARSTLRVFAEQLRRYDFEGDKDDVKAIALFSNYDKPICDLGGWFELDKDGKYILAKGKSKGTRDKGFIEWMLKLPDLMPDARRIAQQILNEN